MSRPKLNYQSKIDTYLSGSDHVKFLSMCKERRASISALAREAIRWYMSNYDKVKSQSKESTSDPLVKAINSGVDRICKMLARQGAAIGTLYELSWMGLPDETAKKAFEAALNTAKQKMRRHVEHDEAQLAEKATKVVTSQ